MEMTKPLSLIIASSHKKRLDWSENLAREVLKPFTTNGVAQFLKYFIESCQLHCSNSNTVYSTYEGPDYSHQKFNSKGQTERRSPAYQRRLEKNARAENQKQMNT